jgi:predicted alpha-1,2-mannosidase
MRKLKIFAILSFVLLLTACTEKERGEDFTKYVNVLIGTGGHGHTYPGAVVPHGMVQLSPGTRTSGWDACSGYHDNDIAIIGFAHTHLSGTGIGDLGDFLFLPYTNELKMVTQFMHDDERPIREDKSRYGSYFNKEDQVAYPGYYSVLLKDYGIKAELTTSTRAGFHRYTFPEAEHAGLFIDLERTIHNRRVVASEFRVISDTEIQGMKQVRGWAPNRFVYFHAEFSEPFEVEQMDDLFAYLKFNSKKAGDQVKIKTGISFVDFDGAKNNLRAEIPHWDFDRVSREANKKWNEELSKIRIKTDDDDARTIFYTGLYRTALSPTIASDVDGRFRTMEQKVEQDANYTNYYVFSMWDTFRAFHPLYTIIKSEKNQALIRSLIRKSDEGGVLPMWELHSNYTGCMIGYHAVPIIVDSYIKGQRDFDVEKAYAAVKKAASHDTINVSPTINRYVLQNLLMPMSKYWKNTKGWIPADWETLSVAKGLEYAYNDWTIAQFAKALGNEEDYQHFSALGQLYREYFDPETKFMRGKMSDGTWRTPFDPTYSDHFADDYCEGNAWQWTWFVPHDAHGLAELMGGREAFITHLDSLFSTCSIIRGENASNDITGLIGQYAHGNEPSHHTIHMYNIMGEAYKTQALVDSVLYSLYFNKPNGLSGNEDAGQISAWYVLNAMGFYSHNPGEPYYSIGRPIFDEAVIHLESGKTFTIRANNQGRANKFIKSARLNGIEMDRLFLSHEDLMKGGVLEFEMTDVSPGPLPWED